jgi:hypothetical protein
VEVAEHGPAGRRERLGEQVVLLGKRLLDGLPYLRSTPLGRALKPSRSSNFEGSEKTMSKPTTAGSPAMIPATNLATTDRGHGQRPISSMLASSTATIRTSGPGCKTPRCNSR